MERDAYFSIDILPCLDFNSHAHVERDYLANEWLTGRKNFNSHAHVERDAAVTTALAANVDFNSHAHVERDGSE